MGDQCTQGDIQVTAAIGHAQLTQLTVKGARSDESTLHGLMPSAEAYEGKSEVAAAQNIAGIYARLYDDIQTGSRTAPSFADGVALHELMDVITR